MALEKGMSWASALTRLQQEGFGNLVTNDLSVRHEKNGTLTTVSTQPGEMSKAEPWSGVPGVSWLVWMAMKEE